MLFTDMEGSTRLLRQLREGYASVLADCRHLLRAAFAQYHGYEVDTQGDAFFVAFIRATDAVLAAVEAQRRLAAHPWPQGASVRVRMGLHTGEPQRSTDGYIGLDVHHAARIMSAGHGGQILLSQTTCDLVAQTMPDSVGLLDLGEHQLKDLQRPSRLFQLVSAGLPTDFPHLRTLDAQLHNLLEQPPAQHEASSMDLLERERYFEQLSELFHTATTGHGRTVLVSGEAGIGKTVLVEQFVSQRCRGARRLWGACEALFTPRPLGPLYDIAAQTRGTLATLLSRDTPRPLVFSALLDELQTSSLPTVVVFEDVHWADEATLDLIKFLGRRIPSLPALFILTYRDDELSLDHPLRSVFGDLPSKAVARLRLVPFSEQAVTRLAQQAHCSVEELYAITGGNPFFVTEVLANETPGTPMTVRDAVLARVARFSPAARALLELASVVPTRTERWLLEAILGAAVSALEECLTSGMLTLDQAIVAFRHELARQAVESTLSPLRRQALHTRVLQALLTHGEDTSQAARLVHHATGAHDGALVLRYAPLAAQQASAQGAHREAAAHYATALRYADQLPPERQAELLEGRAYECYLTGQMEEVLQWCQAALRIWRQLDRADKVGHTLRLLSRFSWVLSKRGDAEQYAAEAVDLLETLPPGAELAMAYSNRAQLAMLANDNTEAVQWGERAITLAESLEDVETLVHALNNVGSAQLNAQDERGRANLERSLRLALERGWEEHAARAYTNLACAAVDARDYPRAVRYLQEGIAYCTGHDLDTYGTYMRAYQALARFEQGTWDDAAEEATRLLDRYRLAARTKIPALVVLDCVRVRRGDPGSIPLLDEARDLALAMGELQRIAPVAAARAEAAWLQGKQEQCLAEARVGYDLALALADGDASAQRSALALFEQLGAQPAAALMQQRLRQQGMQSSLRGPRPLSRTKQAGLTTRQREVLLLMAEGLPNAEIAGRLSIPLTTVDHHISAVLVKLGVHSRAQAISTAYQMGIIPK